MNAQERIEYKESQTLYKKVGRKYVPINDPWAYDGLREGYWLVKVASGSTSIRSCVYPAKAELQAAIKDKEDQLIDIIRKASEARPQRRPISEQAKADWEWFIARNGDEFNTLEYPSIQENAENIIKILLEK
jgi:hypothetical protein